MCLINNEIVTLNLKNSIVKRRWESFLTSTGEFNFSDKEVTVIDETIGIYDGNKLVATGSIAGNVLKYIAVCNKYTTQGAYFNLIVSELIARLFQKKITHYFVFTKEQYSASFQHVGFKELASSEMGAILEGGDRNIEEYVSSITRIPNQDQKKVAAIVMNANPFTNGHQQLVKVASEANDLVYVFVVSNDVSLFTSTERFELVKRGTDQFENVVVVPGKEYMVSYATFPAYFIPTPDTAIKYQTTLDARIFKNQIAPKLNIQKRYLGTEPLSHTTGIYNDTLKRELPPEIQVDEIDRFKDSDGTIITATQVRKAIAKNEITSIRGFVPETTYQFIENNLEELQSKIAKGMRINGN
ncbi:[citrate (pro-3S)-lyase] ligase [Pediococcus claussenii]|uniref:[Citrate [pro-3S]-lyase] ligase n=1 Tax=Pediococcus claussenii (strain ATCC BAA-344 / DSM 14800 / JCM 18046 / KCTC 3811 / LMG 21948 / P06) TaxID=701521 RepID=G8PAL7_PEDCP|nr:[citrate (pro-3S)-lyase] ligase [Pediococcus claussenii ATCC BAA-344]